MEDQVEEIKRKNDIVEVVGAYVTLKKLGRHHKGLCPFHSEKTPSFMVNEEMGLYKCFGCGAGGDVIKFLMEIEGIDFRDALERLAEKAGVKLVSRKREDGDARTKMLEVMNLAARYYHWMLTEGNAGREAREYLAKRNISAKLIETFNLGFSMQSWEGIVNYLVKKKGYKIDILEKVGLVSRKEGGGVYDKFRGRIMFPLQDSSGKVVGFTGRVLPSIAKEGEPKYLNSPETPLYHKSRMLYGFVQAKNAIREKKRVVLVEGQMDCISSFGAGVTETVAIGGTALTEDQVEILARLADQILLSMDADEAGNVAMKRSTEQAERRGLSVKVVQVKGGKDPDEIARNSPEKWKKMVESSVDIYEYVMERAFEKNDSKSIEGIKKITEEVVPFLSKIENNVVREVWSKRLAEKLGVDTKVVVSEMERVYSGKKVEFKKIGENSEDPNDSKIARLAKRFIGLLILKMKDSEVVSPWFSGLTVPGGEGKLISWLFKTNLNIGIEEMMKTMPDELKEIAGEAYMAEGENDKVGEKEVEESAVLLLREVIKMRKSELMDSMNRAKKDNDDAEEERIFGEMNELNKKESKLIAFLG
jgi:DNA primase